MAAHAVIQQRRTPQRVGGGLVAAADRDVPQPRAAPAHLVVALLTGHPDDAEVLEVALVACVRRGADLRMVYACLDRDPEAVATPLGASYALAYVCGALAVARLVPGVRATGDCLPEDALGALRGELAEAELLVVATSAVVDVAAVSTPTRPGPGCSVVRVQSSPAGAGRLRLGYRLALVRELEWDHARADGATTPEALDDAWHVGVACPPLHPETIEAWAASSTWPPRSGPDEGHCAARAHSYPAGRATA